MAQQGDLHYLPTPQGSALLADIGQTITKRTQADENPDRYPDAYVEDSFDIPEHAERTDMDNIANNNPQHVLTGAITPLNILSQQLGIQEAQSDLHNLHSVIPQSVGQKPPAETSNTNMGYVTLRDVERESGSRDFAASPTPIQNDNIQVVVESVTPQVSNSTKTADPNYPASELEVMHNNENGFGDGQPQEFSGLGDGERTVESHLSVMILKINNS
jgi:hypothetical protein